MDSHFYLVAILSNLLRQQLLYISYLCAWWQSILLNLSFFSYYKMNESFKKDLVYSHELGALTLSWLQPELLTALLPDWFLSLGVGTLVWVSKSESPIATLEAWVEGLLLGELTIELKLLFVFLLFLNRFTLRALGAEGNIYIFLLHGYKNVQESKY